MLTDAQRQCLRGWADGRWRVAGGDRQLAGLVALGLMKAGRRKRQPSGLPPSHAYYVYVYRITAAGRAALQPDDTKGSK